MDQYMYNNNGSRISQNQQVETKDLSYYCIVMGVKFDKPPSKIEKFLADYTIIQSLPSFGITYMEQCSQLGKKQLLLKEYEFDTYTQAYEYSLSLEQKSHLSKKCQYLIELQKYFINNNEDVGKEGCSIYGIYNFPHRTLDHQRLERMMKQIRFNQNQIWSILLSCITALNHLENNRIRHLNLSSSSITLDDQGVMRLYDPLLIKNNPNYSQIYQQKSSKNAYICPQLCENIKLKIKHPSIDPYLSDVFVMGLIILQIGLMQYLNQCYSQNYDDFNNEILQQKTIRFSQLYSQDLTSIIRQMTKPIHIRCSSRRALTLIRKYQPPQSKYSSYQQLSKQYQTPQRSRHKSSSRMSIGQQQNLPQQSAKSQKMFESRMIRDQAFVQYQIKDIDSNNKYKNKNKEHSHSYHNDK